MRPKATNKGVASMTTYEMQHGSTRALHYEGPAKAGGPIIVDACQLKPGVFEVMVLRASSGQELASATVHSLPEAQDKYRELLQAHARPADGPAPLSGKYAKLRDDLRAALAAGRAAEDADPEDGGTCNFDAASISLPRWNTAKVEQAAKEAGTGCFVWELGRRRFVFNPNTRAQGNARSRNAEAMTKALRALGYDALDYCQMD